MSRLFTHIKERCNVATSQNYSRYGGRGIKCLFASWQEIETEIGPWPGKGWSIDRLDNDGHYEWGNIRWATAKQQMNNRRCSVGR